MKVLREIGSWALYIVAAFLIAAVLNIFVFQITNVDGPSMLPTLHNGDVYIISKLGHTAGSYPKLNDIVVIDSRTQHVRTFADDVTDIFKHNAISNLLGLNKNDQTFWVKRVIGLPGDTISLAEDGTLYRNGELVDEPYINQEEVPRYAPMEITVPDGYVWVMGDNRNHSSDSRVIGPVPRQNVMGTLKFRLKSGR